MNEAPRPSKVDVRAIAEMFTASRTAFRAFYDEVAAAEGRDSFLVVQARARRSAEASIGDFLDPRVTADAIVVALHALGEPKVIFAFAAAAIAAGLCDPPSTSSDGLDSKRRDLADHLEKIRNPRGLRTTAALQRADLEAIIDRNQEFQDPDALIPAIILARRRLCRIETVAKSGAPVLGTGFLIGPSAVLTNFHVVRDLGDTLHPAVTLKIRFDYSRTTGRPLNESAVYRARVAWRIAASPIGAVEPSPVPPPDANGDGWWHDLLQRADWIAGLSTALDFAVVALDGAPGLQRGWYDLRRIDRAEIAGNCHVLHHPAGQGRTITSGSIAYPDTGGPRLFHTANTVPGSSGGLVVDSNGRPVALHHLGLTVSPPPIAPPRVPGQTCNVAVPLRAIADALMGHFDAIDAVDDIRPMAGCLASGHPVFGRGNLFTGLRRLVDEKCKILTVGRPVRDVVPKPGKTFSIDVLRNLLPAPETVIVALGADQVRAGADDMARILLTAADPGFDRPLPERETTPAAHAMRLADLLRDTMIDRFTGKRMILCIDDLDIHTLADAGGREFLDALYGKIREIPRFCVVLVGLAVRLPSISRDDVFDCPIDAGELDDLPRLFEDWFDLRGGRDTSLGDDARRLIARMAVSRIDTSSPLASLAEVGANLVGPALDELLARART